jgi:hypothetical protein
MIKARTLAGVMLAGALFGSAQTTPELRVFFKEQVGLSDDQIAIIARGGAIAKVLPSQRPSEIVVFGAVFVNAAAEEYVKFAFDIDRLRRLPSYLGVGRISDPPTLADLEGFALEPEDLRDLKTCKPGKCAVQLPTEAMQELQRSLDWSSAPAVASQVNERIQRIALEVLRRYQAEGNSALGIYRDNSHPFDVDAELRSLLGRSEVLPVYLPALSRYLLDYPNTTLPNVESSFYWERVNFGLKPTLRLNHVVTYRSAGPRGAAQVVAVKQLYASHYFQLALDISECIPDMSPDGIKGFYLISLRGSTQQGLTGWKGSLVRRIVVGRIRSAQERTLTAIKKELEEKQSRAGANGPIAGTG